MDPQLGNRIVLLQNPTAFVTWVDHRTSRLNSARHAISQNLCERGQVVFWIDQFDGPDGSLPDANVWNFELGNAEANGWGNRELQYYTSLPDNVSQNGDGQLHVTATMRPDSADYPCWNGQQCPYGSARITTKGKVALVTGRAEARISLPSGVGLWGAFWMLGENGNAWPACGEIDVMEWVGSTPNSVFGTIHGPGFSGENGLSGRVDTVEQLASDYHLYAIEKSATEVIWLMDDQPYHRITQDSLPVGTKWVFADPYYLLLNLAVGGWWPGDPTVDTEFPASMVVDYVSLRGDIALSDHN